MGDHGELAKGIRRVADALDCATDPVGADEAMARRPGPTPRPVSRRGSLVALAAVAVCLVGLGTLLLDVGGADGPVSVVGPPTSHPTTATSTPQVSSPVPPSSEGPGGYEGAPFESLPDGGIAVIEGDRLRLLDTRGEELGTMPAPEPGWRLGLSVLRLRADLSAELAAAYPAQAPEGCEGAAGAGGVRVALCGGEPGRRDRIERVAPDGARSVLVGEAPGSQGRGGWFGAAPSPDGHWLVAQWSGECEIPTAFVSTLEGGELRAVDGAARVDEAVESTALGWSPDGRVLVELGHGLCGRGAEEPGVYAVDPQSGERELLLARTATGDRVLVWERDVHVNTIERDIDRAVAELGLVSCCDQPPDTLVARTGAVWDGMEVEIRGISSGSEPFVPLNDSVLWSQPSEVDGHPVTVGEADPGLFVAFTCGDRVVQLVSGAVRSEETHVAVRSLAGKLLPHLYCTVGERPAAPGHD